MKSQDIQRKTRNVKKSAKYLAGGTAAEATKRRNGFAKSDFGNLRNAAGIGANRCARRPFSEPEGNKRQDISRKTRNRKKIGEIFRGENGFRKRATKRRNGFAKSDFGDLRNAAEIGPNRGNWAPIFGTRRKQTSGYFAKNPKS